MSLNGSHKPTHPNNMKFVRMYLFLSKTVSLTLAFANVNHALVYTESCLTRTAIAYVCDREIRANRLSILYKEIFYGVFFTLCMWTRVWNYFLLWSIEQVKKKFTIFFPLLFYCISLFNSVSHRTVTVTTIIMILVLKIKENYK